MPWHLRLWWWLGKQLTRGHDVARVAAAADVVGRSGLLDLHGAAGDGYDGTQVELDKCPGCGGPVLRMVAMGGARDGEALVAHLSKPAMVGLRAALAELEAECSS